MMCVKNVPGKAARHRYRGLVDILTTTTTTTAMGFSNRNSDIERPRSARQKARPK